MRSDARDDVKLSAPELEVAQVFAALARGRPSRGALLQHRRNHGVHAEHRLVGRLLVVAIIVAALCAEIQARVLRTFE